MNIESYYRILKKRGEDPHEQIHKEPTGVIAFAADLLNNKVVCYNDALRSFFFAFVFMNIFPWILQILHLSLKFRFKWSEEKKDAGVLQKLKIHYIEKSNIIDTSLFKGLIRIQPTPSNAPEMQPQMQHQMLQFGQQMQPQMQLQMQAQLVKAIRPMQQQQGVQRQLFQVQRVLAQQPLVHYAPSWMSAV